MIGTGIKRNSDLVWFTGEWAGSMVEVYVHGPVVKYAIWFAGKGREVVPALNDLVLYGYSVKGRGTESVLNCQL